jgi:membrane fusion protein (multidrug efflux system)
MIRGIVMVSAALLVAACGPSKSESPRATGGAVPGEHVIPVQVEEVRLSPFTETIDLSGSVKSVEDVIVSTEEGGVLREWKYERGRHVNKGDVIAVLNDDILRPMYEAATAQYQIADMNFTKQQKVFVEQGVSEIQVKTAEYQRDAAKAQASLARARYERTRVKAPVSGTLDERRFNEGELTPPGAPVARIVNLDQVKVLVNVPENFAGGIRPGMPVELTVTAIPGVKFQGRLTFVAASVQPENRTVATEATIRNAGGRLKPDMIARVSLLQNIPRDAILVSEGLVMQIDQRTTAVYVVEGGKALRRSVAVGGRKDSKVEIVSGLKPGDQLIVSGTQNLYDGVLVDVKR